MSTITTTQVDVPLFEHEMHVTTRTFGRNAVNVQFAGDMAGTDGNTVFLPALDRNKTLTKTQTMISRGFVSHEAAHIRHTDMPAYQAFGKANGVYAQQLLNAIEDVRVEKLVIAEYPGAKKNLEATTEHVGAELLKRRPPGNPVYSDPQQIIPVAMTWQGRHDLRYACPSNDGCLDALNPVIHSKIKGWASEIPGLKGTQDAIDLTLRILAELKAPKWEPPPKPKEEEGKGEDKGEDEGEGNASAENGGGAGEKNGRKEGEGKGEGKGGGEGNDYRVGEGDTEDSDGSHVWEAGKRGGAGAEGIGKTISLDEMKRAVDKISVAPVSTFVEPLPVDLNIKSALASALNEAGGYAAMSTDRDAVFSRMGRPGEHGATGVYKAGMLLPTARGLSRHRAVVAKMRGELSVMQRKIERAMAARNRRDMTGGHEYGRLDPKVFAAVVSRGYPNAFRRKSEATYVNTAVSLVNDFSGSMSGSKAELACLATIALTETLDRIGVATEVIGFSCSAGMGTGTLSDGAWEEMRARCRRTPGAWRTEPLSLFVLKDFDEPLRIARPALACMPAMVGGNNCDGESVEIAYRRLRLRPEPRKIMMVLSDGMPAVYGVTGSGGSFEAALKAHLRKVVADIDRHLPIIGIGIMTKAVESFYPKHVVLNELSELPRIVVDQMARLILGQGFQASNKEHADVA